MCFTARELLMFGIDIRISFALGYRLQDELRFQCMVERMS